jgi:predicted thioesterase
MTQIPIGVKGELRLLVTSEVAIDFLGQESARVLGTPHLIANLEMAARNAVQKYLDPGMDTVGARVDLRHLAATPMGMSVAFYAEVVSVDRRRVNYNIWAHDEKEKIAEGTHERFIINVERFAERVAAKASGE